MKHSITLLSLILATFIFACSGSDKNTSKTIEFKTLKAGDKLGGFTIAEVGTDYSDQAIIFEDGIAVEGTLNYMESPGYFVINKQLFNEKIDYDGTIFDLSQEKDFSIIEKGEIMRRIKEEWKQKTMNNWEFKDEFKNKIQIKVVIDNLTIDPQNMVLIDAHLNKILEFNGQKMIG